MKKLQAISLCLLNSVTDLYRKHVKFYGISVCEGYVVGKGRVIYTQPYFLKNNHAKFHTGFAFLSLFLIWFFLSSELGLVNPGIILVRRPEIVLSLLSLLHFLLSFSPDVLLDTLDLETSEKLLSSSLR